MKTILISGGGGYLGTYLTQVLLKKNKVSVYDDFFFKWLYANRKKIKFNNRLKILKKDIIDVVPKDFKDVCVETDKGRYWSPSVFTTENYNVVPMVEEGELKWRIFAHVDPKTEVKVPSFADAFKMVEKLEKLIGHKIQQQKNN